jgi:hypothetical protein
VLYAPGTKILKRGRTQDIFERDEKILTQHVAGKIIATLDTERYYALQTINLVFSKNKEEFSNKYILAILNSHLMNFYYDCYFNMGSEFTTAVATFNLDLLPIKHVSINDQKILIEKIDAMLKLNKYARSEVNSFKEWLQLNFNIEKFSQKLDKYYKLDLKELLSELQKKKVKLNSNDIKEINKEFSSNKDRVIRLYTKIESIDNEINRMVYDLYGLTNEEIKIIENNI